MNFEKYQGTGNDFVMIDDRNNRFELENLELVRKICDRRFGIGADGLILIREHDTLDFEMIYYNSDGSQSLCGNGSRCALKFAQKLGMINNSARFLAIDGEHEGFIKDDLVHVKMGDVEGAQILEKDYFINTGSPHYIQFVEDVEHFPVERDGARIRYGDPYAKNGGTNVNFVEVIDQNSVFVRTYERGVEGETLSCGTGVTAVSLAMGLKGADSPVIVKTPGGQLQVSFTHDAEQGFKEIFLIGPAEFVFDGRIEF